MRNYRKIFVLFILLIIMFPVVKVRAAATYDIYVSDKNGNNEKIYNVSSLTTVLELKNLIYEKNNILVERQKLFFSNIELANDGIGDNVYVNILLLIVSSIGLLGIGLYKRDKDY